MFSENFLTKIATCCVIACCENRLFFAYLRTGSLTLANRRVVSGVLLDFFNVFTSDKNGCKRQRCHANGVPSVSEWCSSSFATTRNTITLGYGAVDDRDSHVRCHAWRRFRGTPCGRRLWDGVGCDAILPQVPLVTASVEEQPTMEPMEAAGYGGVHKRN